MQLSLITGLYSVQSFGSGMVSTCIPMYATAIGLPESVGLIVALPSMAALFVNLPGGVVVDIFGRKRPLIVGALMTGFGTLWMAVSGGIASVIGNRLLIGAGFSIWSTAMDACQGDTVSRLGQHKGRALGYMSTASSISYTVGPLIAGALVTGGGVMLPLAMAGISTLLTVPLIRCLNDTSPAASQTSAARTNDYAAGPATPSLPTSSWRKSVRHYQELLQDPDQQAVLVSQLVLQVSMSAHMTIVPLYAIATYAATPLQVGSLISVIGFTGFFGAPLGGWMADRVGRRPTILISASACGAAFLVIPCVDTHAALLAALAVAGLSDAMLGTASAALVIDVTPANRRGIQSALSSQVGDMAYTIAPIVLTAVATMISYNAAFASASSLVGAGVYYFARRRGGPTQ